MLEILFWISLVLIAYAYFVYPLILLAYAYFFPRPVRSGEIAPTISLIIACHNEEATIGSKLANIEDLDYSSDRLQVVVASDGSTDKTESIIRRWDRYQVKLVCLPRSGKAAALNAAVRIATGEILVFTDANSILEKDALKSLVRPFADPSVGGVAGNQRYAKQTASDHRDQGERAYWSYDRFLKKMESRCGNVVSATGAIYAIRRDLFRTVPPGVTDDFVISTRVIEQGRRLVFSESAVAYEPASVSARNEFRRKVRLMTRGQYSLWVMRRLLQPFEHKFYAVELWSHKLLRRMLFLPLTLLFVCNLALFDDGGAYLSFGILQASFYAMAVIGLFAGRLTENVPKWATLPEYFRHVERSSMRCDNEPVTRPSN